MKTEHRKMPVPFHPKLIEALRELKSVTKGTLPDAIQTMNDIFGFEHWQDLSLWLRENHITLEAARGPHTVTILKAIAAKHGRLNVSTPR